MMNDLKNMFIYLTLIIVTGHVDATFTGDSNMLSGSPVIQQLSARLSALEELNEHQQHRISELESRNLAQQKQDEIQQQRITELESRGLVQQKNDELQQQRITELESRALTQQETITNMEATVRNQQHELKELTGSLTETKQALYKLHNVLAAENEDVQETETIEAVQAGENIHLSRRQQSTVTRVAFTAILVHTRTDLGHDQNIVFDQVETNIGNAYNQHHGVFIAPVAGTYVFYVNIFSYLDGRSWGRIMVNGINKADVFVQGGADRHDQNSQMLIIQLKKGDDVAIQNYHPHDNVFGDANLWTSFSGFLLYQDAEVTSILG